MTRATRRIHLVMWLVLGPLIAVGFYVGLAHRPAVSAAVEVWP